MIKLIGALLIAVVFFIAGYIAGQKKLGSLESKLNSAQSVIRGQKDDIVKKLEQARFRIRLAELKERIGDARANVVDKNFGAASSEVDEARKILDSIIADSKGDLRKDFTPVVVGLDEVKAGLEKMDATVKTKLENLRTQVEEIQKKLAE